MKPTPAAYLKAFALSLIATLAIGALAQYLFDMVMYQYLISGAAITIYLAYKKQKSTYIEKQ